MRKIIIQFNEANFDLIEKYSVKYNLKGFKKILKFKTIIKHLLKLITINSNPDTMVFFYTQKL